jgi:hypothetical protein
LFFPGDRNKPIIERFSISWALVKQRPKYENRENSIVILIVKKKARQFSTPPGLFTFVSDYFIEERLVVILQSMVVGLEQVGPVGASGRFFQGDGRSRGFLDKSGNVGLADHGTRGLGNDLQDRSYSEKSAKD